MLKLNYRLKAISLLIAPAMELLRIRLVVNGGWVLKDGMSITNLTHR
jgi:hypothetical protein